MTDIKGKQLSSLGVIVLAAMISLHGGLKLLPRLAMLIATLIFIGVTIFVLFPGIARNISFSRKSIFRLETKIIDLDRLSEKRINISVGALFLAISFFRSFYRPVVQMNYVFLIFFLLSFASFIFLFLKPPSWGRILLFIVIIGIVYRTLLITHIPLDYRRADMLPIVQEACANFLRGVNPYHALYMPWKFPLVYLPLTWLTYLPFYALGIDIRLANIIATLVIIYLLYKLAQADINESPLLLAPLIAFFYTREAILNDVTSEVPVFWMFFTISFFLLVRRRFGWSALFFGLSLSTLQTALVFVPVLLVYLYKRLGLRKLFELAIISLLVASLLILPFMIGSISSFLESTIFRLQRFALEKWEQNQAWMEVIGFSGWFYLWGKSRYLQPIQIILLLIVMILAYSRIRTSSDCFLYISLAYLSFILFADMIAIYYYIPLLILLIFRIFGEENAYKMKNEIGN